MRYETGIVVRLIEYTTQSRRRVRKYEAVSTFRFWLMYLVPSCVVGWVKRLPRVEGGLWEGVGLDVWFQVEIQLCDNEVVAILSTENSWTEQEHRVFASATPCQERR